MPIQARILVLFVFLVLSGTTKAQDSSVQAQLESSKKMNDVADELLLTYTFPDSTIALAEGAEDQLRAIIDNGNADQALLDSARHQLIRSIRIQGISRHIILGDAEAGKKNYFRGLEENKLAHNHGEEAALYHGLGYYYQDIAQFDSSLYFFNVSKDLYEEQDNEAGVTEQLLCMAAVNTYLNKDTAAVVTLQECLRRALELDDTVLLCLIYNELGYAMHASFSKDTAALYLSKAVKLSYTAGLSNVRAAALINLGSIYERKERWDEALKQYRMGEAVADSIGDLHTGTSAATHLASIYYAQGKLDSAMFFALKGRQLSEQSSNLMFQRDNTKFLYRISEQKEDWSNAFKYLKDFVLFNDSVTNMENREAVLRSQLDYEYEKKELVREAKLTQQRLAILAIAIGLVFTIILSVVIYRSKRKSEDLLLNILPAETAAELSQKGSAETQEYEMATVMFTDFKDFIQMTDKLPSKELVAELDHCFRAFDDIIKKHGIEKIKTIGDSYMAVGGIPVPDKDNPRAVVAAAVEINEWMKSRYAQKGDNTFQVRIGVHTGPIISGVVGKLKFQYDIWGDTVNTASRMESSGEVGKVNISDSTYQLIQDSFHCEYRGEIEAKGKGKVKMYFVQA